MELFDTTPPLQVQLGFSILLKTRMRRLTEPSVLVEEQFSPPHPIYGYHYDYRCYPTSLFRPWAHPLCTRARWRVSVVVLLVRPSAEKRRFFRR